MEQVVARGIRWLDSGAALALVVRGETLARLAEQMRDSHGGRISFQSNARAALLIPVDEDDAGIFLPGVGIEFADEVTYMLLIVCV